MAIVSNEDLIQRLTTLIGESTTDENISLIEDVTDTLQDYIERAKDTTDWKEKYTENDREWRKRYTERFSNNCAQVDENSPNGIKDDENSQHKDDSQNSEKLTFDSLFKEE